MTHRIQVVGVGCSACRQLEADVRAVVKAHQWSAIVERIDDVAQIAALGILSLPSLLVDGVLVGTGCRGQRRTEQILRNAFAP